MTIKLKNNFFIYIELVKCSKKIFSTALNSFIKVYRQSNDALPEHLSIHKNKQEDKLYALDVKIPKTMYGK